MANIRIVITHKRLIQQNGIVSLQSNRELLKKVFSPYHQHRLKRFCGAECLRTTQLIRWLGPELPKLLAETDRTLTAQRTWLVFCTPPSQLQCWQTTPTPCESASVVDCHTTKLKHFIVHMAHWVRRAGKSIARMQRQRHHMTTHDLLIELLYNQHFMCNSKV